jgi:AcrR family transcriptional regulator
MHVCIRQERCYNPAAMNLSTALSQPRRRAIVATRPNKHQERTKETRRVLLKSARMVFARDGFERCRIEDIAAVAGYTRGAFYANFKTKEELFFALLQEETDKHAACIHTIVEANDSVERRVSALRDYYVQCIADREWCMLMLEFKLFAARHPKLRPRLAAIHRRIRSSMKLEVLHKLLGYDNSDPEPRRAVLEGVMTGLFLERSYDPERLSERQAAKFLGRIFDSLLPLSDESSGS